MTSDSAGFGHGGGSRALRARSRPGPIVRPRYFGRVDLDGLTPEQKARVEIDRKLKAASWVVQDFKQMDLSAGRGVAVREFPTATGPADYLLYGDRKALG